MSPLLSQKVQETDTLVHRCHLQTQQSGDANIIVFIFIMFIFIVLILLVFMFVLILFKFFSVVSSISKNY